jgi:hypothetical protein
MSHGGDGGHGHAAFVRDVVPGANGPLRVCIDEQHARATLVRRHREAYGRRALADSALLSEKRNDHASRQ